MPDISMTPVTSSALKAIGYDPATKTMHVEFPTGVRWTYAGVPQEEFDAVKDADSVGRAFGQRIKGLYQGAKVEADPPPASAGEEVHPLTKAGVPGDV